MGFHTLLFFVTIFDDFLFYPSLLLFGFCLFLLSFSYWWAIG
ncbi:hypothetical protein LEP1GSC110_0819 [Leptospira interrogans serovar Medanensis str. UT053]|uniref:Uncharacterized protein n=1 Tax=Leptospira interrogans str. UI 12758 TaxID=1049938 RepID=A0A0E2DLT1_LEPIR|nr:hypothetical protein LEP1GSC105_4231 [Leptospira interrogans str. UI 12758]EMN94378.1 hypothetical protein LEP1GSC110_0819 [Leptospira interrogans serovar Medanensis str. UT053]